MAGRDLARSETSQWRQQACVHTLWITYFRGPLFFRKTSKTSNSIWQGEIWLAQRRHRACVHMLWITCFSGPHFFWKKSLKRVIPYGRARFGLLRDVPVAASRMRSHAMNYMFQESTKFVRKTSKTSNSVWQGEIWLAQRRPGGGIEHAFTRYELHISGVHKKFPNNVKNE